MLNYIKADILRVLTRVRRWIILGIILLLIGALSIQSPDSHATGVSNLENLETTLQAMPLIIGYIEILYVFGDDFKGKTAQIAIGMGVKRREVVLSKWIEVVILAFLDTFAAALVAIVVTAFSPAPIPLELYGELIIQCLICVLSVAGYMALVLPILFAAQGTTVAMLIYMLLSSKLMHKLFELLGKIKELSPLHLSNYTLTNCLNVLRSRLLLGSMHFESLAGIVIYLSVFVTMAVFIYRKLELEF